jgi:hypothetical protein
VRRTATLLAATALVLPACGGDGNDDEPTPTGAQTTPATVPTVPTATGPQSPTISTPEANEPTVPTINLEAPRDGDQYLEGSSDSLADFKCRNAASCRATVQQQGGAPSAIKNGGALPTEPGTYTFVVTAAGNTGEKTEESATYEVPDLPGDGGAGKDTKPPKDLPEAGP